MATKTGALIESLAGAQMQAQAMPRYPLGTIPIRRTYAGTPGGTVTPEDSAQNLCEVFFPFAANPADGDLLQIGSITYRFKNALAQAYDVKISTDRDATAFNLEKAINTSGSSGFDYHAGTVIHPDVTGARDAINHWLRARAKRTSGEILACTITSGGGQLTAPIDAQSNAWSPYALYVVEYGKANLHVLGLWGNMEGPIAAGGQSSIVMTIHAGDDITMAHGLQLIIPVHATLTGIVARNASHPCHDILKPSDLIRGTMALQAGVSATAGWWGYLQMLDANGNEIF